MKVVIGSLSVAIFLFLASATEARANMLLWPSAVILAISPIKWFVAIFVVEAFIIDRFTKINPINAYIGSGAANGVSSAIGAIPVIVIGAKVEEYLRSIPISITVGVLIGVCLAALLIPLINTALEYPVWRLFRAPPGLHTLKIVYLSNLVTTLPLLVLFYFGEV